MSSGEMQKGFACCSEFLLLYLSYLMVALPYAVQTENLPDHTGEHIYQNKQWCEKPEWIKCISWFFRIKEFSCRSARVQICRVLTSTTCQQHAHQLKRLKKRQGATGCLTKVGASIRRQQICP